MLKQNVCSQILSLFVTAPREPLLLLNAVSAKNVLLDLAASYRYLPCPVDTMYPASRIRKSLSLVIPLQNNRAAVKLPWRARRDTSLAQGFLKQLRILG